MSKSITKNVRYDKFNNHCVTAEGVDIQETKMKGITDLNTCLAQCARNHTKCSAVEYYEKGWGGDKCFHILQGLGKMKAAKGKEGKRFRDSTCYVRG